MRVEKNHKKDNVKKSKQQIRIQKQRYPIYKVKIIIIAN